MLTDTQIRNAKATEKPVKLNDGKGLYVEIRPNGSKLWRYRYEIGGKENLFAVGEYSQPPAGETDAQAQARRDGRSFTLAEARAERERCRGLVKQGIHPSHQQRTETLRRSVESANTFKAVAETWIEENEKDWSENYSRQTDVDRATRRADTIRWRLGWEPGILNGEGGKPKGMHWRTFARLQAEHDAYVTTSLAGMAQRLGLINRRLGDCCSDLDDLIRQG